MEGGGERCLKWRRLLTHGRRIVIVGGESTPVLAFDLVYSIDGLKEFVCKRMRLG
jgi:hypothetical protein